MVTTPMPKRSHAETIVVIGGSQGSIEALLSILPALPPDLPAAIFIVVHIPADARSYLADVLRRSGTEWPVSSPEDGDPVIAGTIHVSRPDCHLTLENGLICVRKGPRENRHRPAIDPLFRTAARSFGPQVIALVLSGNLDDGSAGMYAVRARGGTGIIQDPRDAQVAEMPQRALAYAGADYVLPVARIPQKLIDLIQQRVSSMKSKKRSSSAKKASRQPRDLEVRVNEEVKRNEESFGNPSVFACPECHGVLFEIKEGKLSRFRCRIGHAYNPASLKQELDQSGERALWAAMRALEEKAAMGRRMMESPQAKNLKNSGFGKSLREQVDADTANAQVIREMIFGKN
jgi:two-component system chemotaxis response regulator CheB